MFITCSSHTKNFDNVSDLALYFFLKHLKMIVLIPHLSFCSAFNKCPDMCQLIKQILVGRSQSTIAIFPSVS